MFYNKSQLIDFREKEPEYDHRTKAVKGTGEDFKKSMIEVYTNLTNHMPDNGLQILMFNHTKVETWKDMLDIIQESHLYITAAWPIDIEPGNGLKKGNHYKCTMVIVCRKRLFELEPITKENVLKEYIKVSADMLLDDEMHEVDNKIMKWVNAIKVMSSYKCNFDVIELLNNLD